LPLRGQLNDQLIYKWFKTSTHANGFPSI